MIASGTALIQQFFFTWNIIQSSSEYMYEVKAGKLIEIKSFKSYWIHGNHFQLAESEL